MDQLFVYGSLLFPDVLSVVLGRQIGDHELKDAALHGYRRYALQDVPYPVIRRSRDDAVDGKIIRLSEAELSRVDYFEAKFYKRTLVSVHMQDGIRKAYTYVDTRTEALPESEWDVDIFRAMSLEEYVRRAAERMAHFGNL